MFACSRSDLEGRHPCSVMQLFIIICVVFIFSVGVRAQESPDKDVQSTLQLDVPAQVNMALILNPTTKSLMFLLYGPDKEVLKLLVVHCETL